MRRFPAIVLELRTARANHVPHSTLRFPDRKHPHRWTRADSILQLALTTHEDGLCPGCGQPRDRAWNDDMADLYHAHTVTCLACKVRYEDGPGRSERTPADHTFVTDDAPAGFVPDPRLGPQGLTASRS